MVLGSTQPLTEINLPGGKGRPARKADFTAICEPIAEALPVPPKEILTNLGTTLFSQGLLDGEGAGYATNRCIRI
jgi:hypothetical protein